MNQSERFFQRPVHAVMIIGPNGVGKTKIAYDLAREQNGEIINLDRTYLFKHFPMTTGLKDTFKEKGVARHLYELLQPNEDSYPAKDFCEMVFEVGSKIAGAGKMVVAEGASTIYVPELLKLNSKRKFFQHVIGIRFPAGFDIECKYFERISQAFREGLAEEISGNLHRFANSFIVKECHFAVPTVRYLKGEISLDDAKQEIVKRCLDYKDLQLRIFAQHPEIEWIDGGTLSECRSKLNAILGC